MTKLYRGRIATKIEARAQLALPGATVSAGERARLRRAASGDDVILQLVEGYAPLWLAAILGAAVMAAVMSSDSQILALSTMFAEDIFAFYGGRRRFGEAVQVRTGRIFVVVLTLVAYAIALEMPQSIFDLATQYAFAGYAERCFSCLQPAIRVCSLSRATDRTRTCCAEYPCA